MSRIFCIDLTVRTYELDQYGVVNNAVYQNYLEQARSEFLAEAGVDTAQVAGAGRSLALSQISIKYLGPLVSGDAFQIRTSVARLTGVRTVFRQRIIKDSTGALILEAEAVAVFLDERGRPMRISPKVRDGLSVFLETP